mgnify:FL=1
MRLNVILITIVLGGLISGAAFFIFGYPVNVQTANLVAEPLSGGQARLSFRTGAEGTISQRESENLGGQAFLLPVAETNYSPVRDFNILEPVIEARAAVLYDVNSGRFLYAHNVNKRLPIASVTKLMTAIVVMDNFNLDDIYTVPAENVNVDGFGADLYRGERLKGADLFKIMLIKSSNDAALTFATQAQSQGIDLEAKMNEKARQLGMTNTHFSDPAGLDDQDAFSTAADLIKLVSYAAGYDLISELLTTRVADVTSVDGRISHHLINTNQLLGQITGIIVGKTGHTDSALGTMVLEVGIDTGGERLISVVLGSSDRFGETRKLIEWGKKAYSWK